MKPSTGVALELLALAIIVLGLSAVPHGVLFLVYLPVAQFLATFLVHCPAHYVVGRSVGIRFTKMVLGTTALARTLPPRFSKVARMFPILTLGTDRATLQSASRGRTAAMYASGAVASVSSGILFALWATFYSEPTAATLAWLVAIVYLLFDVVFSPRSGDIKRARSIP